MPKVQNTMKGGRIVDKELQEHYFPLSLSQQNILNLEHALPGTSVNNISTTVRVTGHLDFPLLQESIHRVLENDTSLCTRLTQKDGELVQYHIPYLREDFPVYDFSNTSEEGIGNWETAVTREPIPLEEGPLYRFVLFRDGEGSGGILVKLHHIIADGWSQIMTCNKIGQTYLELLAGKEVSLVQAPDYELHVQEEQNYLASKAFKRDEAYWKKVLEESGEPSVLKTVNSAAVSPVGRRMSFELPQILNHAIYSYCMEKRVAPFAVFYMALAIYFKRIGGAQRFTIGVPIFNRTNYKFKQSTGMFVTTLPFYNEINDEWTLNQFNEKLMESWYEMLRHQRYPFSKITELAGRDGRLFNIALSYQDSKIYESRDASVMLSGRWHYCGYQAEQLTIHLTNLKNHQQYAVDYDYLAQFFGEEEIVSLHNSLCEILNEALSEPDKPVHRLHVLSMEQKEKLLYTFNRTDRYLEELPVYEALVRSCSEYQNRAAVICDGERVTYGAFLYKSAGYACALSGCDVKSDDLVAILLPRKAELPAAMVGSLQAGCGYLVLSEELPVERIKRILGQSGAKVLITSEKGKRRIGECDINVLTTEEITAGGTVFYTKSANEESGEKQVGERLAYVVYTSGSTGEPKGVEITHRNLLNLAQEMADIYGQGAVLSVCNVGFDVFMLESIVALLNGRTIVLPGDEDLESPERLAALINGHAVGFFSMTPSRLAAFMQNHAFCRAMRKMESIVCGGEAFPAELLKKLKKLSNARIYNQYGPSETTVGVSLKELSHADRITAGRPMGNCRLYVLDKWMNPLPAGGYGHLYIGGKCVGRGYRNQPELTKEAFRDNPFVADERIYYTGDVASWTADGEIVLAGRLDDQVKLRGLRVELQEIVSCIEAYPGVSGAAARICELNGQPVIGVYYCAQETVSEPQILSHAATYLPRYMLPSFMVRLDALPINANGKVDEKRLPMPDMAQSHSQGELSHTAETVLEVFRSVLHREEIYGDSDYFLAGGNSLNAMECVTGIEDRLGRKLRIADLYACRSAVKVAAYLDGDTVSGSAAQAQPSQKNKTFGKAPEQAEYPLSPVQQGMYIQSLLDPSGLSYHMPGAFVLEERPDEARLENAFAALIKEEPIFRTVFRQGTEGLSAHVLEEIPFRVEQLVAADFAQASQVFLRPFDLGKAPLLRAALWQSREGQWYLFIDSHHIIGDGMSTPLILKRLDQAYREGSIKIDWNYYDYIYAMEQEDKGSLKQQELAYWKTHLQNLPEVLTLPGDSVRPKKFDYKGTEYECLLSEQESEACDKFCREKGISGFVLFLAAYGVLLSAAAGREDFVIGAPVAGRTIPQTQQICGPFINTLPLRLQPQRGITVSEWLARVQAEVAGMLDHQQVSLEEIIQELNLPRGEQNALYQVMLTQSPVDEGAFRLAGASMKYKPISTGAVKMDMIVEAARKGNAYALRFSYATSIFEEETIRFYGRSLKQILSEMIKKQDVPIDRLKLLSQQDYQKYVEIPNYEVTPFVNLPIHKILHNKALAIADTTAIIFHGERITYAQLERRASAIAYFLEEKGAQPGQCIGLCLSRTPDMIAAMYATLKVGCAYVFILPAFPGARRSYMLKVSDAKLLLYDEKAAKQMPENFPGEVLPCHAYLLPEGEAEEYIDRPIRRDQLVNVLFTSGSTGKPKGVMLRHRSISNLYTQMKTLLDPVEGNVLCSTNSVFDCFVVETLIALALGRTVVLADEEEMMLPWKLAGLVETYHTGIFEMTPSRLQMCLGNDAFCQAARNIKVVLLGGEVVTQTLSDKFYQYSDGVLMNMYGPTEATVFTTMGAVRPGGHITIGKPLQNTRTYVLDEHLKPVIPTACGELYIAGECLAAGYVSRPELTESSFVDDIYFPGEKMYRSGDLVRLRADGSFDYVGRKDAQVKLNGQRVELGEIAGAMLEAGCIKQATVVPIRKEDGSMELCAFYESGKYEDVQEEILAHLRKVLPVYMIPARMLAVDKMPMTATNKIDMQTLLDFAAEGKQSAIGSSADARFSEEKAQAAEENSPAAEENSPASEKVSPAAEEVSPAAEDTKKKIRVNTEYVLSVWNRVLSVPVQNPESSFFEQGGTSMGALNVLSHYFNDHLEMSLSEFYENPTAAGQAALLKKTAKKAEKTELTADLNGAQDSTAQNGAERDSIVQNSTEQDSTAQNGDVQSAADSQNAAAESYEGIKIEWSLNKKATNKKRRDKAVLVTGATGFFGAHLVRSLLTENRQVICLMRDGDAARLHQCLAWYFGQGLLMSAKDHLKVVKGDISRDHLGMSERDYIMLTARIGEIYHCAADVRHYAADEESYLGTNVSGTANMLAFARLAGAAFYHMSTCSVSGEHLKDGNGETAFTEKDYEIGQDWEKNIYVKSKFLAEGLVLQAVKEGLNGKIFRLGRLVGRASDGVFQRNPETNVFYLLMKAFCQLGAVPESAAHEAVDLMPIDVCVEEVLNLTESNGLIYHIMSHVPPMLGEVVKALDERIQIVTEKEFVKLMEERAKGLDKELAALLMDHWHRSKANPPTISVTNTLTMEHLAEAGYHPEIPSPGQILKGFYMQDS